MNKILKKYNLNPKKWDYIGQWESPVFSMSFWVHWYNKRLALKMGLDSLNGHLMHLNGHELISRIDKDNIERSFKKACDENPIKFFKRYNNVSLKLINEHKNLVKELESSVGIDIKLFEKFVVSAERIIIPWQTSVILSLKTEDIIREIAEKNNIPFQRVMTKIFFSGSLIEKALSEAMDIRKILQKRGLLKYCESSPKKALDILKQYPSILKMIENYIKEYAWISTHCFWGSPLTPEKFIKDLSLLTEKKKINKKINFKFNNKLEQLIKVVNGFGFLRQYSAEIFNLVAYKARPLFRQLAKELNLSYEDFIWLTSREILSMLNGGKKISKEYIKKRKKNVCLFLWHDEEILITNSKDINFLKNIFIPKKEKISSELKGVAASKGFAKGYVKVFLKSENFSKMKKGDILVAPMTTPDFVPLMQRAGAVVTDIGGFLCHAAIVSREMNKPCIIGTKFATQVLHDGDLVEVDANKGVVKIIKKA